MTELNLDHPAVEAAVKGWFGTATGSDEGDMCAALNTALDHLTADDLRNTEAGQQILREGQEQGWTECADHVALHAVGLGHTMLSKNPYKMEEK